MATKKRSKRKSSLVENINRRKRTGTSRPRSRSAVSREAYAEMQRGWPNASKKKKAKKHVERTKTHTQRAARSRKANR